MSILCNVAIILRKPILCRLLSAKRSNLSSCTVKYSTPSVKAIHRVNTNVDKDVVLFTYENPKFFRYMNMFAIVQYVMWTYLGVVAFQSLKDAPVEKSQTTEETPWYYKLNLGSNKYKNTLSIFALIIGTGTLTLIWMYTLRTVRYLILNKGGSHISFVTYSPFGYNRILKVPLEHICCKENRKTAKVHLPIKVKNIWMHYILDMKGEFKNTILFDSTAGLKRIL